MVKGISKEAVLVRPRGDAVFEEAVFILKDGVTGVSEEELLRQAGYAVNASYLAKYGKVLSFLAGAGSMGLFFTLLFLF
ncbi:MAG: hypothetical protein J6K84_02385 [Oscillospiraceae bacterium]|nr:hypothetical protein [Oscillospiraceae bacterium]